MTRSRDRKTPGTEEATVAQRPSSRSASSSKSATASDARLLRPDALAGESVPQPSVPGTGSGSGRITDSVLVEVMIGEEVARAHGFSGVIALASFGVMAALPILGGDPLAKRSCAAALFAICCASIWIWRYTRGPFEVARYKRSAFRLYGWTLVFAVTFVEHYVGYFSAVTVVLALGAYYLGQSSDRSHSFLLPIVGIATYALLATLTAFEVIVDRGLFPATDSELSSRLFSIFAASTVLVFTLRMARVARAAVREAIERSNDALLVAQRREAQLAEANHQLDRALRVSVGKKGRYTGVLAGDYRLGIVIGVGAVGEVYEAESTRDASRVAVKLLQATAAEREDLMERILREGEISSKLDHPHTVRVFEVGRLSDGNPYLIMELLEGRDLAARLRQEGSLSIDELVRLAEQLSAGLAHAHAAGIVHRDLKPLNIFDAGNADAPCWKILDFGVSRLESSSGTLTQGGVVGTPSYMSPEQARGIDVDYRSDLFSLAVVLYRAMTGQPAFAGDSTPQVMFDIVYKMPRRPGSATKGLSLDLDRVMAIALAKDPKDRFQSAVEVSQAFALACHRRLTPQLRERADALIERYPWGSTIAQR